MNDVKHGLRIVSYVMYRERVYVGYTDEQMADLRRVRGAGVVLQRWQGFDISVMTMIFCNGALSVYWVDIDKNLAISADVVKVVRLCLLVVEFESHTQSMAKFHLRWASTYTST